MILPFFYNLYQMHNKTCVITLFSSQLVLVKLILILPRNKEKELLSSINSICCYTANKIHPFTNFDIYMTLGHGHGILPSHNIISTMHKFPMRNPETKCQRKK